MTEKLYYENSFLYDFAASVIGRRTLEDGRTALVLDRTAFYPTSGGQVFDTGWLELENAGQSTKLRVAEVIEADGGEVLHVLESAPELTGDVLQVRGLVDAERRRDHMQQHSGQHVLSAAFIEVLGLPTVSFHMGDESCTIDLEAKSLSTEQAAKVEQRANAIIWEDRPVTVTYATEDEARGMGVRKIPKADHEKLRLVDIKDFDLCACGGTHVRSTGQIGAIQVRKVQKVKQGIRVEFVCGVRALKHARKDYETLVEAASAFSSHVWDVPSQVKKAIEDNKAAAKQSHRQMEEIAELTAREMIRERAGQDGPKIIAQVLENRDLTFAKLLAQKLAASASDVVALLGAGAGQPALVFAQVPGMPHDMGALMKAAMTRLGSRGGGSRDLAQGGVPDVNLLGTVIDETKAAILASTGR